MAALPAQFRQPDLAMLGNLHRRMGDEDPAIGARAATGTASGPSGSGTRRAWAASCIPTSTSSNRVTQPHSDGHVSGLQVDSDLFVTDTWKSGVRDRYRLPRRQRRRHRQRLRAHGTGGQQRPALAFPRRVRDLDGCQWLVRRQRAGRQSALRREARHLPPSLRQGQQLRGFGGKGQGLCAERALEHRAVRGSSHRRSRGSGRSCRSLAPDRAPGRQSLPVRRCAR